MNSAPRARLAALLGLASAATASASCDGCKRSAPYTPYTLGAPAPSATQRPSTAGAPSTTTPSTSSRSAPFERVMAVGPGADATRWVLGRVPIAAPVGRSFAAGLVFDADRDGAPDLVALLTPRDGFGGELVLWPGASPDRPMTLATVPAELAPRACVARATLARVAEQLVALEVEPQCPAAEPASVRRFVSIERLVDPVDKGRPPSLALELRLAPAREGEALEASVAGRDVDGDGRDDLVVTFKLSGAEKPLPPAEAPVAASLQYLDRAGGLSRDPSEPGASLRAAAQTLYAGRRRSSAVRVAGGARAVRRLYAALCEEGKRPLLRTSLGAVHCGGDAAVELATAAEVEAALAAKDPAMALAALTRADAVGLRRKETDAELERQVPRLAPRFVHRTTAAPELPGSLALSPLAFDAGGDLWIATAAGAVRLDHATLGEAPPAPSPRFLRKLSSGAGEGSVELLGVEQRCDAPTLVATLRRSTGEPFSAPLPIPTPLRCAATGSPPLRLLGVGPEGLLLAVGADIVALPQGAPPEVAASLAVMGERSYGAARSPDGKTFAVETARGLLLGTLKGEGRAATGVIVTGLGMAGADRCVPSDGAARIACVVEGAAALYELPRR